MDLVSFTSKGDDLFFRSCHVEEYKYSIGDFVLVKTRSQSDDNARVGRIETFQDRGSKYESDKRIIGLVSWFLQKGDIPGVKQGERELVLDRRNEADYGRILATNIAYPCEVVHAKDLSKSDKTSFYFSSGYDGKIVTKLSDRDSKPKLQYSMKRKSSENTSPQRSKRSARSAKNDAFLDITLTDNETDSQSDDLDDLFSEKLRNSMRLGSDRLRAKKSQDKHVVTTLSTPMEKKQGQRAYIVSGTPISVGQEVDTKSSKSSRSSLSAHMSTPMSKSNATSRVLSTSDTVRSMTKSTRESLTRSTTESLTKSTGESLIKSTEKSRRKRAPKKNLIESVEYVDDNVSIRQASPSHERDPYEFTSDDQESPKKRSAHATSRISLKSDLRDVEHALNDRLAHSVLIGAASTKINEESITPSRLRHKTPLVAEQPSIASNSSRSLNNTPQLENSDMGETRRYTRVRSAATPISERDTENVWTTRTSTTKQLTYGNSERTSKTSSATPNIKDTRIRPSSSSASKQDTEDNLVRSTRASSAKLDTGSTRVRTSRMSAARLDTEDSEVKASRTLTKRNTEGTNVRTTKTPGIKQDTEDIRATRRAPAAIQDTDDTGSRTTRRAPAAIQDTEGTRVRTSRRTPAADQDTQDTKVRSSRKAPAADRDTEDTRVRFRRRAPAAIQDTEDSRIRATRRAPATDRDVEDTRVRSSRRAPAADWDTEDTKVRASRRAPAVDRDTEETKVKASRTPAAGHVGLDTANEVKQKPASIHMGKVEGLKKSKRYQLDTNLLYSDSENGSSSDSDPEDASAGDLSDSETSHVSIKNTRPVQCSADTVSLNPSGMSETTSVQNYEQSQRSSAKRSQKAAADSKQISTTGRPQRSTTKRSVTEQVQRSPIEEVFKSSHTPRVSRSNTGLREMYDTKRIRPSTTTRSGIKSAKDSDDESDLSSKSETVQRRVRKTPKRAAVKRVNYREADTVQDDSDEDETFDAQKVDSDSSEDDCVGPEVKRSKSGKSSQKTPKVSKSQASVTPGRRRGTDALTPSVPTRRNPLKACGTPLERARAQLHVSVVPDSLPCREEEFANILSYVESKLQNGTGGCLYISGVPGTGKTATVYEVMKYLKEEQSKQIVPDFKFVEINGMRLTQPHQAFVQIYKQLTDKKVTSDHATSLLDAMFCKARRQGRIVLLVDELDLLMTRKQDVLYNLFDWPTKPHSRLVVLAIANTMDLPERVMMNRVSSRLGLNRMTFQPYTFQQLQEIVHSRLSGISAFDSDAVQLASRKVAAVSGDARRALDICRRSTEVAEAAGEELVTMFHVDKALQEMFSSPKITAIRNCSLYEKLVLQAIMAEFTRSGLEEATLCQVFRHIGALCQMERMPTIRMTQMNQICSNLNNIKLVLLECNGNGIYQRIRLNVGQEDVQYALREEKP